MRHGLLKPALLCFTLVSIGGWHVAATQPAEPEPVESGVVERTGVSLVLLDVVVLDAEGRPMPDLVKSDFKVRLDGRSHEIYSLDDLCPFELDGEGQWVAVDRDVMPAGDAKGAGGESRTLVVPDVPRKVDEFLEAVPSNRIEEKMRFVIYLEFSQLSAQGRALAIEEAARWVREAMKVTDEAKVVGYATRRGIKEFGSFTNNKTLLLDAIARADADPEMADAHAAARRMHLQTCCEPCGVPECCRGCCPTGREICSQYAWEEYTQARGSLGALMRLLRGLETVPGRKALLMFHQNLTYQPAAIYSSDVPDQNRMLEEVAVEANLSRTSVYSAFTGDTMDSRPWAGQFAVNLGANLADYTGGGYNRGATDLAELTAAAGRETACVYRIGLRPPRDKPGRRIFTAYITVRGRELPRYRVQFLPPLDRWWRTAQSMIADPEAAKDVPVTAALVPVRAANGRWDVAVQVALDPKALQLVPSGKRVSGDWEVGAMLANDKGRRLQEMLALSRLNYRGDERALVAILHEREFTGLPPGTYELRTFVRDRTANSHGGGRARLALPPPDKVNIVGPVVRRLDGRHVQTSLPLIKKKELTSRTTASRIVTGPLPISGRAISAGEPLEFLTWVCPLAEKSSIFDMRRYVSRGEEPLFRMENPTVARAGECVSIRDRFETDAMEPGRYAYHAAWQPGAAEDPLAARVEFDVRLPVSPATTPETTRGGAAAPR